MGTRTWGLYLDGLLVEKFSEAEYSHHEMLQQLAFALDESGEMHELKLVQPGELTIEQLPGRKPRHTP